MPCQVDAKVGHILLLKSVHVSMDSTLHHKKEREGGVGVKEHSGCLAAKKKKKIDQSIARKETTYILPHSLPVYCCGRSQRMTGRCSLLEESAVHNCHRCQDRVDYMP